MAEQNQCLDFLALPSDVLGLIFNKLDVIDEIRSHRCVAKSWNKVYWSTLTGVYINSNSLSALEDRHLLYVLTRVNPLRLYSLDLIKQAPKLTSSSLSLLSQFINLKYLRLNGITSDLLSQTVTNLISLRELDLRSTHLNDDCMDSIADKLSKLTRLLCARSEQLRRWPNAYKMTQLKELTVALTRSLTADGYADIAKLSNLTFLNVNANQNINNECLQHILSMTNLESLFFMDAKVTLPRAYSGLAKMTKLRKLQGYFLPNEETYSYLSQAYSLTTLVFEGNQSTYPEMSAKFISALTGLKFLMGVKMKDTQLLSTLTNLTKLYTQSQNIGEEFPLEVMTNLKEIQVNSIDSRAFKKLTNLVDLKSLCFQLITNPQENDFDGIQNCQNLRTLRYSGPRISDKHFEYVTQCTQLIDLYIGLPNTCADNFSKLVQLTSLELRSADWKMEHFKKLTVLTKLSYLRIFNNTSIQSKDEMIIKNLFSPDIRTRLTVNDSQIWSALLDGLEKLNITLPPHRLWWYHRLLKTSLYNMGPTEDIHQLICVLVMAYEEIQNEEMSGQQIEKLGVALNIYAHEYRKRSFNAFFIKLWITNADYYPRIWSLTRCCSFYRISYRQSVHECPVDWSLDSIELKSYFNIKNYDKYHIYDEEGNQAVNPAKGGFYFLRIEKPSSERFVDKNGILWIEMMDFQPPTVSKWLAVQ